MYIQNPKILTGLVQATESRIGIDRYLGNIIQLIPKIPLVLLNKGTEICR